MLSRTTAFARRGAGLLALLAALSACLPANQPTPSATLPTKTVTLTSLPSPSPSSTPGVTLSPTPKACLSSTTPGQVVNGVVDSALLAKPMTYRVYLPPCYAEESDRRYPTLYLLHGQTYNEDQWLRLGVSSTMDKLISSGEIPPFIIVLPYDYSYLQPTQYPFEDVFMNALIPQIDAAYRTISNPVYRAVGGLSRGGAWALHLGIRHPDVFGVIGAHSPAIFYSDGGSLRTALRDLPQEKLPRLFIDIGDADEELPNILVFKNFLDEHAIPYEWHSYVGFHDEVYWAAHVEGYLRWYAQGWSNQ